MVGGTTLIICATIGDMDNIQSEMIGALQCALVQLEPPYIVFTTRTGWEAKRAEAGNTRSRTVPTTGFAIDSVSRLGATTLPMLRNERSLWQSGT